ncbi:MAG TPA: TonB-dependent siderophore receptor [Steroidobacteraceae bacterium]|nr:TonB-dependent siderophore receptor [Steroidobacteraceae bacterium]
MIRGIVGLTIFAAVAGISVAEAGDDAPNSGLAPLQPPTAASAPVKAESSRSVEEGDLGGVTTRTVVKSSQFDVSPTNSYDSIKNVAGVGTDDSKAGVFADNILIRGIHLLSASSYRLDGGFAAINVVGLSEDKESVEVLKGANALLYGITSPGGIVNFVMKRPKADPYEAISVAGASTGQVIGAMDVSRRFGDEGRFGVRVNLAGGHVASYVDSTGGPKALASLTADWDPTDRLAVKLDFEHFSQNAVDQAVLDLPKAINGIITLPNLDRYDPTLLRSGLWDKNLTVGTNVLLSANYRIVDGWSVLLEGGQSEIFRTRILSQISAYKLDSGDGTLTYTLTPRTKGLNTYLKAELNFQKTFGIVDNDLAVGVNRNQRDNSNPATTQYKTTQNIYIPLSVPAPGPFKSEVDVPQNSYDIGPYVFDSLTLYERLHIVGGVRYLTYNADYAQATGASYKTKTEQWVPAFGAIFDLTPRLSIYSSYMKALSETGVAPIGAVNYGSVLPPETSTQKEVGIRSNKLDGVTASLGYYQFSEANAVINPLTNIYEINGTTNFHGIEGSFDIHPYRSWSINAGALYLLQALQIAPLQSSINGRMVENMPRLAGNLSGTYHLDYIPGLALTAGTNYVGRKYVDPANEGTISSYEIFNLLAAYSPRLDGHRTRFTLGVSNLLDRRYWSTAAQGALGLGATRTIKASAQVAF